MTDDPKPGLAAVRAVISNAKPRKRAAGAAALTDDASAPSPMVRWETTDIPIIPVGYCGQSNVLIDSGGQLAIIHAEKMTRLTLIALVGNAEYFYRWFPRIDARGGIVGWRPEGVCESLTRACREKGVVDLTEMLRGRGTWRGPGGELVFHCGDVILTSAKPGGGHE